MLAAFCGLLGLVFGSFANVVIYRVPRGESVVRPPSACPGCGTHIAGRDNIPIVSWLVLRGRCRQCGEPISPRYPLVEGLMALIFAAVGARVGLEWSLPGFLLFAWTLVVVSFIDVETRRIPNRLTYPLTPALLVLMVGAAFAVGEPERAVTVVVSGLAAFGFMFLLALFPGMGMGDAKLAGFIGIALGYLRGEVANGYLFVVFGLFAGFLLGALGGVALLAVRATSGGPLRKQKIPFGPYLAAGGLTSLLVGAPLIAAYLRSLGIT